MAKAQRGKAWNVIWADGRAVQTFAKEADARRFHHDYRNEDCSAPSFGPAKGRIRTSYDGPAKSMRGRRGR
jgi:hypothetical protein